MDEKKKHLFGKGLAVGIGASFLFFGAILCLFVIFYTGIVKRLGTSSNDVKLQYIKTLINQYYYEDVDDEVLQDGIYSGLVKSLGDKYSTYYNAEQYKQQMVDITGNYAGVGALLQKDVKTGDVVIAKVYHDTPAEEAGLRAGDAILDADGHSAYDSDLDVFVKYIRGAEGTEVTLTIDRDGEEMDIKCKRAKVAVPSVEYQMLDNNIGYIEMTQFSGNTAADFKKAMTDLQAQNMQGVIVDLRSNGGGLLDSVTEILDYLLPEGTTVYIVDKHGNRRDYKSDKAFVDIPMVVLTSGATASASEIFTGAVRDYKYATIIGTKTFGKGIVQSTVPLGDGSALKITTATYYTPNGDCIHGVGIAPDIELEFEYEGDVNADYEIKYDNQVNKAIELLLSAAK